MTGPVSRRRTIDDLLDRAVHAINGGDRATADALAARVLAVDQSNVEAEELLAAPADHGELRRITIQFVDLVDSTALSTRTEPETYRTVVTRYRDEVLRIVDQYGGHVSDTKGDGLLALFGHPQPHEDDARRAVQAGLDITRAIARLSAQVQRRFGFDINVRVGIHRGVVYLDTARDEVYGFAPNFAARMCSIAEPGAVAVSAAVERLIRDTFELEPGQPQKVKGVDELVVPYRPIGEREPTYASPGPLIGRQRELADLETSWQQAEAGTPVVAGLAFCGEPGIGKSRLARAAVSMAQRSDGVVIELLGSPLHTDVGLHPVRRLLERRAGIARASDSEERLHLLRAEVHAHSLDPDIMIPLLAPVLGISSKAGYVPVPAEGNKLFEKISGAIHDYLVAWIGDRPGLVVAEDMHWFDPATAHVMHTVLTAGLRRSLVVMTSREAPSVPDDSTTKVLQLNPLTDAETHELITALHPDMPIADRTAVDRRCGGVPLYIEEVVAKLKEQPTDAESSTNVPDTLYEALFARLRSSENAIRVAEAAATIGSQFDRELLRNVVEMSDDELDRVLVELRASTVLEPLGDGTWRYRHELLREVAVELPPPRIRQELHSRVADALKTASAQGDPDWPLIAAHFEHARRFDEAASAYQQASSTARHRGALAEARMYLSRALGQLDQLPQDADRDRREIALRLRRGFLAAAAEGPGSVDTAADFERCLELAGTDLHADELFATLMALFTYYVTRADFSRAQQIVESLRVGVDAGRDWWRTENIGGAGTVAWFRGEFDDASRYSEEAAELMGSRGQHDFEAEWFMPHDPVVLGLCAIALARWVRGDLSGADDALARSAQRTEGLGFPQGPFSMCYLRYVEFWICIESGRLQRAAESAADMGERAQDHGFDQWTALGGTLVSLASAAMAIGEGHADAPAVSDAITVLTGWAEVCRLLGAKVFVTSFDDQIARLLVAAGRLAEARERADAGLALADETDMHYYDAELLRLRAATHEDSEARHADLLAALQLAHGQGAFVFALRAALDDYRLRGEAARASVDDAMKLFPPDCDWPEFVQARTALG